MTDLVSLTENEIYERIVVTVLDHRLPPGTKLIEDRLATAFGVSRTRIRPVLVRLANEQIVTLTPNRGATVAQPTEKEAREVFQVRQMIESTLMECFIKSDSLRELVSRTSLILMTYGGHPLQAQPDAVSCGCLEHRALLDALRLRDAPGAACLMRGHLARLEAQLQFNQPESDSPDLMALFSCEAMAVDALAV